jgi:hypothetical protein
MRRGFAWALAIGMALTLGGCGGSEESKMERGLVVDDEVAAPESDREMDMTEAERRAADLAEDQKEDAEAFDEEAR